MSRDTAIGFWAGVLLGAVWMYFAPLAQVRNVARAWACRRVLRRIEALQSYAGKLVRHAKTGRVGFCVEPGYLRHERWDVFAPLVVLRVCYCPHCARRLQAGGNGMMILQGLFGGLHGCECLPAAECTIAPEADARAFREAMRAAQGDQEEGR